MGFLFSEFQLPQEPIPREEIKADGELACIAQTLGDILAENEAGVFQDIPLAVPDAVPDDPLANLVTEVINDDLEFVDLPKDEEPLPDDIVAEEGTRETENEVSVALETHADSGKENRDCRPEPPEPQQKPEILEQYVPMWRNLSCELCQPSKKFEKRAHFELHFARAHQIRIAQCHECGKTFNTRVGGLLKHKRIEHFKGVFHCDYCPCKLKNKKIKFDTMAGRADELVEHIRSAHLKPEGMH